MKYKAVYRFKWLLIVCLIGLIYLCNLILIKLPFLSISFPKIDLSQGIYNFFLSFFPRLHYEIQIYNIQTVFVWSCGVVFGSRLAFITLLIYLLLGLIGLPLFAGGGGFDYFKEPTFGYLLSLPLLAYLSGSLYENKKKFLSVLVPIFTTHIFGIVYILLFKQSYLDITWHLSFSMIGYDLIFALLFLPILPIISFFIIEMFVEEVLVRESIFKDYDPKLLYAGTKYRAKGIKNL